MTANACIAISTSSTRNWVCGVPTWLPCRLQIYFNGHNWLAARLRRQKVDFTLMDNAFVHISDWTRAQQIADELDINRLHRRLDQFARRFCPIHRSFGVAYHWSVDQCEYATDIVFGKQADLKAIYETLSRTAIHTVKPDNIARLPGVQTRRSLPGRAWKSPQCPHRRKADQTHHGAGLAEALRHVRSQSAH